MKRFKHIEELISEYAQKRGAIRLRLQEFQNVKPEQYFYELLYCLMTPQSSAVNAAKAQKKFEEADFLHTSVEPESFLFHKEHYIRFHKTKSVWIREMKAQFDSILPVLLNGIPAKEKREWLVKHVKGLSYKEATHFLRNIGMNDSLAILDRHILRNLKYHSVVRSLPKALTEKKYLSIEKKFLLFAREINISTDELDLLFWSREAGEILK